MMEKRNKRLQDPQIDKIHSHAFMNKGLITIIDQEASIVSEVSESVFALNWVLQYLTYFSCYLTCNVLLLALYAIQVFSEHSPCKTQSGADVTKSFEFAFNLGFTILAIDGLNTNVLNIFLQFKAITQRESADFKNCWAYKILTVSNCAEWILRFSILAVSLTQFLTNH